MESTHSTRRTTSVGVAALLLLAAIAVAVMANALVAVAAVALGPEPALPALRPTTFIPFTVVGTLIAFVGWIVVRRIARRPDRVLTVLVPVALAVTLVPDLAVALGYVEGGTVVAGVALGLMHLVTVVIIVPVFNRIAPVAR